MNGKSAETSGQYALRTLRQAAKYSIDDLALTSGLTQAEIIAAEEGKASNAATIARVMAVLNAATRR